MLPVALAWFSCGSIAVHYVMPFLLMTSCLHIMEYATGKWRIIKVTHQGQHWTDNTVALLYF